MSYKNSEGYPNPTEGEAIRRAGHMPTRIWNIYQALKSVAGLLGLEIMGLRDRKANKEWPK